MPTEANQTPDPGELYRLGLEAFRRGDQPESKRLNEEALDMARRQLDEVNEVRALIGLSRVAFREGDHTEVERLAEACLPIWERLLDKTIVTSPYHMLAESHRLHGRFHEARKFYLRNIEEARAIHDDEMVEVEMINLALLEVAAGNPQEAMDLFAASPAIGSERIHIFSLLAAQRVSRRGMPRRVFPTLLHP